MNFEINEVKRYPEYLCVRVEKGTKMRIKKKVGKNNMARFVRYALEDKLK